MAMTTRTVAEIRQDLIAAHAVYDPDLDTSEGSDAWITSNAIAGIAAELQARDVELSRSTLPSTATGTDLDEHARVWLGEDNGRQEATQWFGTVNISRDGVSTPAVAGGTVLVAADGTQYQTAENVVAADWTADTITIIAESVDEHIGTTGNKAATSVLTVSSPPAGLSSTASIAATTTEALDEEDDEHLRGRILEITAGRPGAGNASDYVTWATAVSGVYAAWTYPRWDGIGTCTVVVCGPARSRVASVATRTAAQAAIDAARPCGATVTVETVSLTSTTVTPTIGVATGYEPGWTGTRTTSAAAHTSTRVFVTASPVGTIGVGDWIVAPIGANLFSCCRQVRDVQPPYIDVSEAFVDENGDESACLAAGGGTVRPGTSNYNDIVEAIRDVFDNLGPSAWNGTGTAAQRYPAPATSWCPHLYRSDLFAAIESVEGVVYCDITAPAANTANSVAPAAALTMLSFNPTIVVTWATV